MSGAPSRVYDQILSELVRNEEVARDAWVMAPVGQASKAIDAYHRALAARSNFQCWFAPMEIAA